MASMWTATMVAFGAALYARGTSILAHDDQSGEAQHASFASVQDDHVRLELGQALLDLVAPYGVTGKVDSRRVGSLENNPLTAPRPSANWLLAYISSVPAPLQ